MPSKRKSAHQANQAAKQARRAAKVDRPSGQSAYGRKRAYLIKAMPMEPTSLGNEGGVTAALTAL